MPKGSLTHSGRLNAKDKQIDGLRHSEASTPTVTPAQMEITHLRAEVLRLCMERDIAKEAAVYFAQDALRATPGWIQ